MRCVADAIRTAVFRMSGSRVRSLSSLLDASDEGLSASKPVSRSRNPWSRHRGDGEIAAIVLMGLLTIGSVLGLVLPASDELHGPYRRISVMIGWTYFCR